MDLVFGAALLFAIAGGLVWYVDTSIKKITEQKPPEIKVEHNNDVVLQQFQSLKQDLKKEVPEKVLQSITGSANNYKGRYGELVGYLSIRAEYDKVIPLGDIVDFVGIRYDSEGKVGSVDFIDIKSGKSARLSPDQRKMKALVDDNKIGFRTIKIEDINLS